MSGEQSRRNFLRLGAGLLGTTGLSGCMFGNPMVTDGGTGIYTQPQDRITFIEDDGATQIKEATVARELTHALQDQHINLPKSHQSYLPPYWRGYNGEQGSRRLGGFCLVPRILAFREINDAPADREYGEPKR